MARLAALLNASQAAQQERDEQISHLEMKLGQEKEARSNLEDLHRSETQDLFFASMDVVSG